MVRRIRFSRPSIARPPRVALALLSATAIAALGGTSAAGEEGKQAGNAEKATLALRVVDRDRQPLAGATGTLGSTEVRTDGQGRATLTLGLGDQPSALATLRVRHPRAGSLLEREVPLTAGDKRRYRIELRGGRVVRWFAGVPRAAIDERRLEALPPKIRALGRRSAGRRSQIRLAARPMCSGHDSLTRPPGTIRVARRANNSPSGGIYRVDTVDFNLYVRRVLPQEWGPSWNMQSLMAGSLAVKSYGWARSTIEGPRSVNGTCYDVDDTTNYQVYKESTTPTTDWATNAVWRSFVRKNNQAIIAFYLAGTPGMACGSGNDGGIRMRQWGTKTCADQGKAWFDIVDDYYFPSSIYTVDVAPFANELAFVAQQYRDFLRRNVDSGAANFWIDQLYNRSSWLDVIHSIYSSPESNAKISGAVRLYYAAFGRHPDNGVKSWLNKPLRDVARGLILSSEGVGKLPENPEAFVRQVYRFAFGREARSNEVTFWATYVRNEGRSAALVGISESNEHKERRYGQVAVNRAYIGMLDRVPDTSGRNYWVGRVQYARGYAERDMLASIRGSNEYRNRIDRLW